MNQDTQKSADWLDGAAVVLSALCLVHCLALPLIVAGVPFLAQFAETHLHFQVLVIVIPLSVVALAIGFRRHRDSRILAGGALGMLLLIIGATVAHTELGLLADRLFTIAGSLMLAAAHFFNSYRKKFANSSL
ncbi:MAG: MerC domain-containing protein [Woeseiaceae bacterium]